MIIKYYKPYTPSTRSKSTLDFSFLTKKKPEKTLTFFYHKAVGRNNQGKITTRHKERGHKKLYRKIDFKRNKTNIYGTVKAIEYDPNRNANIALITYLDGQKRYIIHPEGLHLGDTICSGNNIEIKLGSSMPLISLPLGTKVHNIELYPGKGGQFCRSAGAKAKILAKEKNMVVIRLPSKEVRLFNGQCMATIGSIGNSDYNKIKLGKAGRNRWLGIRPTVRGSAMNPIDHPHGGGEGRSPIGKKGPVTPWGKPTLGVKTRNKRKQSENFIIQHRK